MKNLAIFVVSLAITVAMQLKESPPIQSVDPRLTERWGFMGLQPNQSPPSQVGAVAGACAYGQLYCRCLRELPVAR